MTGNGEPSGPGMCRNQAGELRYWTGQSWDPREAASIWTRVWCFIIDMVLFSLILFPVLFGVGFLIGTLDPGQENAPTGLSWLLSAAIFLLYFSISYAGAGRTLGMALGRIEVVYLPDRGARPSISTAVLRSMILGLAVAIPLLAVIWLGVAAGSKTRQGPHDKAAYTAVLRKRPRHSEPTTQVTPLASEPRLDYGPRPDMPPAFDPSAAAVVGGPGEFAPPSKGSRRKWVIALIAVLVAAVAIISAVLIDSRIKQSETLELLSAVDQTESTFTRWTSDPRWEDVFATKAADDARCSDDQSCYDEVWATFVGGVNSIARDYIAQMQRDILDVEGQSTLPWHRDIRTAQDAYLDNANVMLDILKWNATLSPTTKTPDWTQFDAELATTYVIAKRRFMEIKFVPASPQDVQRAIDRVFTD